MLKSILSLLLVIPAMILSMFRKPVEKPALPEYISEEAPSLKDNQTADKIIGNGSEFYIVRPVSEKLTEVHSADFGMSPENEDNTAAMCGALEYCKSNPGTKLVIDEGTYYFRQANKIVLSRLDTCFIDGKNAKFIFSKTGTFFQISQCNCVEFNGLSIDVDRVGNPLDDVMEIRNNNKDAHTLEFVFFEKSDVPEDMIISAVTQCDPETLTFGAKDGSREIYVYMNPDVIKKVEKISPNVLRITHDGAFDSYQDGERYIVRRHVYDGQVFSLGAASRDITFDGVNIFGSYGSGYGAGDLAGHWQIINSYIGVDPEDTTGAHVSQGADGIHIAGSSGFFNLENCDIWGQGDDALNVHDGIGYVSEVSGNTIRMYSSQTRINAGEYLAFKDDTFNETGFRAKILSAAQGDGSSTEKVITFDTDVSDKVKVGYIAYNTVTDSGNYVIRNNYIHENRARGLLLQSDNGLCEGNRFYKIEGQAIKIVMDIRPDLWQEGTGVNNLIIRNNTFEQCDYSGWGEQITIDTYIDGHYADCYVFRNIDITGNTFKNFGKYVINAMNVNGLDFSGNKIEAASAGNNVYLQKHCANVSLENEWSGKHAAAASVVRGTAENFIIYNS